MPRLVSWTFEEASVVRNHARGLQESLMGKSQTIEGNSTRWLRRADDDMREESQMIDNRDLIHADNSRNVWV